MNTFLLISSIIIGIMGLYYAYKDYHSIKKNKPNRRRNPEEIKLSKYNVNSRLIITDYDKKLDEAIVAYENAINISQSNLQSSTKKITIVDADKKSKAEILGEVALILNLDTNAYLEPDTEKQKY